jgi:FKBP-type peptidyl-prolyl cis-trans isomerase FkpA
MRALLPAVILFLPLLLSGCEGGPFKPSVPTIETTEFAPELGVDLSLMTRTASGLYYRDLHVGGGIVVGAGHRVQVRYTGWLTDGWRFDHNDPPRDPLFFVVGSGQMIPGFDRGVMGMRVGSRRQLVIPPSLGYGSRPQGSIPANSILVFVVEILAAS